MPIGTQFEKQGVLALEISAWAAANPPPSRFSIHSETIDPFGPFAFFVYVMNSLCGVKVHFPILYELIVIICCSILRRGLARA